MSSGVVRPGIPWTAGFVAGPTSGPSTRSRASCVRTADPRSRVRGSCRDPNISSQASSLVPISSAGASASLQHGFGGRHCSSRSGQADSGHPIPTERSLIDRGSDARRRVADRERPRRDRSARSTHQSHGPRRTQPDPEHRNPPTSLGPSGNLGPVFRHRARRAASRTRTNQPQPTSRPLRLAQARHGRP